MGYRRADGNVWFDLFAVLMLAGSIGVELHTVGNFLEARAARSWPRAVGRVLRSEVVESGGHSRAEVRYGYTVAGKTFEEVASKYRSEVEPWVRKYPVGARVEVFHNPASPGESTLVAGPDAVDYVIIVTPVFFGTFMATYLGTRAVACFRWIARGIGRRDMQAPL